MLAKGRLLGLQFLALLGEAGDLFQTPYYQLAARANTLAKKICDAFTEKGCQMLYSSPTNQQFPIIPEAWAAKLAQRYSFSPMGQPETGRRTVRFCTSWATTPGCRSASCRHRRFVIYLYAIKNMLFCKMYRARLWPYRGRWVKVPRSPATVTVGSPGGASGFFTSDGEGCRFGNTPAGKTAPFCQGRRAFFLSIIRN